MRKRRALCRAGSAGTRAREWWGQSHPTHSPEPSQPRLSAARRHHLTHSTGSGQRVLCSGGEEARPNRTLKWGIGIAFHGLPPAARRALAGRRSQRDGQTLDPDLQLLLRLGRMASRRAPAPTLESRRQQLEVGGPLVGGPVEAGVGATDVTLAGPGAGIPGRLYLPDGLAKGSPLLSSTTVVPGSPGAWTVTTGSAVSWPRMPQFGSSPSVIGSHRYTRSRQPSTTRSQPTSTPGKRPPTWGADPGAVAVGGDSAGGNLAAVVAHLAVRAGRPAPAFLLLFYPHCDTANRSRSRELFGQGFGLTSEEIEWFTGNICRPAPTARTRGPASLTHRTCPACRPPTGRLAGSILARRGRSLRRPAGLRRRRRHPAAGTDLMHGFANLLGISVRCREAVAHAAGALRAGLALTGPTGPVPRRARRHLKGPMRRRDTASKDHHRDCLGDERGEHRRGFLEVGRDHQIGQHGHHGAVRIRRAAWL